MKYAVVDLFCGIGGLTKGLELSGLNVIAGIDIDSTCAFAYKKNNNADFLCNDISDISAEEISALYPPNSLRILVGCAPCQPFSTYSRRYRKDGRKDSKWKLLYSFLNIVECIKPEIVSMENVPQLATENVFDDFVNSLQTMGYSVSWQVVYCPDYGIPQNRRRLVLLASKRGNIDLIPPLYNKDSYLTVRDAIGNLPPLIAGEQSTEDPLHVCSKLSDVNLKRIRTSIPGGTWRDWDESLQLNCHKKKTGNTYPAVYGRMFWDKPSPTITTQFYGYGNGRFGHPEQDRALSLREGAILQSFPADYIFIDDKHSSSKHELGIHIGNAVPVELGKAIGISILNHLKETE